MKDPEFDELEKLAKEFPKTSTENTTSHPEIDQFERQLNQLSMRQVVAPKNNSDYHDDFFF